MGYWSKGFDREEDWMVARIVKQDSDITIVSSPIQWMQI